MEEKINFDPRMTDETKRIVEKALKSRSKVPLEIPEHRKLQEARDDKRNKLFNFPAIDEVHIPFKYNDYELELIAYVPKHYLPSAPIVVYMHGGNYIYTWKSFKPTLSYWATQSNCIWIHIQFSFYPDRRLPVQIDECISAFKWICDHKTELFKCTKDTKVGVCGDCFGAILCCILSHEIPSYVSFQMQIYPSFHDQTYAYDEFTDECYLMTPDQMFFGLCHGSRDDNDFESPRYTQIKYENFEELCKTLIICIEMDPYSYAQKRYIEKLKEFKVDFECHVIKGVVRSFPRYPEMYRNAFNECTEYILNFLRRNYLTILSHL